MRSVVSLILAPCLFLAACTAVPSATVDVHPDVDGWRARSPRAQGVRAYAASLEGLNPGRRGAFDATDGLTLEEAESVALVFNADLRVARLRARVPLAGAHEAGVPEDPRLELDFLHIVRSIATPWILASAVKVTLPLSGRLGRERDRAFAEADAALRAAHLAEWSLVVGLREAWNRWSATGERIALLESHLVRVDAVLAIALAQREAEQIGAPQARVLEIEQVTRTGELDALRLLHERELLGLKALLGLVPEADVELVPSFSPDPAYLDLDVERAQLRAVNLELALARAEYRAAHQALRHEAAQRFPDLEIGPLLESEEGVERLGAGAGISLPLWNRNRRAIAEACAARAAARAAYQARYEDLVARLSVSRAECQATARRSAWLREQVAPMADLQLEDVQRLGELGDMDVLILKDALSSVLETKLQLLEARIERSLASNRRRALVEPLRTPDRETTVR